ncbi:MAG: Holliday junction helicase RuvA, holliday junction helicase RuvA [Parcubacteria group bacterium]|nr:Holliday junction helicase RuvA, holliday junction helicase RuvA [Parcubacteria group bacterium]
MISKLKGVIEHKDAKFIILMVGGVGYKIFLASEQLEKVRESANISLWTYLAVREDALTLYGFEEKEGLNFFEMLISISGIGPKTALGVINVATIPTLKKAVASEDISHLVKVSGIGKKIAEKIILELKGKFGREESGEISLKDEVDTMEALKSLGYSQNQAREALKQVDKEITNVSERVKQALKILGK